MDHAPERARRQRGYFVVTPGNRLEYREGHDLPNIITIPIWPKRPVLRISQIPTARFAFGSIQHVHLPQRLFRGLISPTLLQRAIEETDAVGGPRFIPPYDFRMAMGLNEGLRFDVLIYAEAEDTAMKWANRLLPLLLAACEREYVVMLTRRERRRKARRHSRGRRTARRVGRTETRHYTDARSIVLLLEQVYGPGLAKEIECMNKADNEHAERRRAAEWPPPLTS